MPLSIEIERAERGFVVDSYSEPNGPSVHRAAFGEEEREALIRHVEALLDQEDADRATAQGQSN